MPQRLTLADIADQAGVSTATVSRVLNGKSNVAESTRHQVLAALDVLGYERPESLHQASKGLIGLIVPELSNPVFPLFAQEIEQLLAPTGRTPLLCTQTPGGISEDEYIEMLVDRGVDGIIFVCGRHADTTSDVTRYHRLRERGVQVVTINGNAPTITAPGFTTDDSAAARMAVEHLISLGHRRIGLAMGPTRMVPAQRKRSGYGDAMRAALPDEPLRIAEALFTYEGGLTAGARLVEQGCTAVFCGSDIMALGVVQAVRNAGLSVPKDVSVVGYDDSPLIALTDPPLTTVRQPVSAMCRAAVSTILSAIDGGEPADAEMSFIPDLIVRSSTAPAPSSPHEGS
ncbi:LacI family DNA-binding transcriptional regulator [Actinomyces slackii]|uniref:Degradation activator n=1 Tax=Actinomyces slackii TaxID=52774 RepID=A0A448KET3_9ACTO|nr:LacI family DNA-binding transcriptional regulator [Actinomyces slackii]VEG75418.1 Degradation activator [Actinomyces slackii]